MAKNDTAALFGALVITVGLLGASGWWFLQQKDGVETVLPNESSSNIPQGTMGDRLSSGEKLLIKTDNSPTKLQGIEAYAKGDYVQAQQLFQASLQATPNDPEALIYLNNAKASQSADAVAIAAVVSIPTDTDTNIAKEILRGVAQAQKEFIDSGKALKIMLADDDGDKAIATEVAQELTKKPEILAVIGHSTSDVSVAAAPVYEQNGLVMISATSTTAALSAAGNYIFRTVPSDRFMANALAKYLLDNLKVQKIAIFYSAASDYSTSLNESLTTDLFGQGGNVVATIDISKTGFNAAQALNDAKGKGAEAIALLTNTPTFNQAMQVLQVNKNQLPVVAGDSMYKPETLQIGGRDAEGMALAIPWHILSNPDAIFPKSSRALWGGDVNWRSALGYDATQALITVFQQTPNPDRNTVQTTLANPNFSASGAAESIQFLPSGDRNQAQQIVVVQEGDRSGFGYDFVPIP